MRRNLRALALTAVGGLLMLAPAGTAFATSPIQFPSVLQPQDAQATTWSVFRTSMVNRLTLVDGLDDPFVGESFEKGTQTVDGGRYDGKTVPG